MKAILAADRNWGIGKDGKLLFSVPKDMAYFRETTTGKIVVMGRKTLESFPGGRPLKNRVNVVLTSDPSPREGCVTVGGLKELSRTLAKYDGNDVFVIGGAKVYAELLEYCDEILVTKIEADGGADAFFPDLDVREDFFLAEEGERQESNGLFFRFTVYKNLAPKSL